MKQITRRIVLGAISLLTVGAPFMLITTVVVADGHSQEPQRVSIVALIASPRQYNGVRVYVTGYLDLAYESDAVYFHEEDFRYGMTKNAVKLVLQNGQREQFKALSRKYVIVEGTFTADDLQGGMFSGHIVDVTGIRESLTEEEFLRRQNKPAGRVAHSSPVLA
jgi:hypothetical protein